MTQPFAVVVFGQKVAVPRPAWTLCSLVSSQVRAEPPTGTVPATQRRHSPFFAL
jgi:hypothetical protein